MVQSLSFYDEFISLGIVSSRFIHLLHVAEFPSSLKLNNILFYVYTTSKNNDFLFHLQILNLHLVSIRMKLNLRLRSTPEAAGCPDLRCPGPLGVC